jgi:hypothetical protein
MTYKLIDQTNRLEIAKGNQLDFNIKVDLENRTMTVRQGVINAVYDIAPDDVFTLIFRKP